MRRNHFLPFNFLGKKVNDAAKEVTDFLNDAVGKSYFQLILKLHSLCTALNSAFKSSLFVSMVQVVGKI